MTTYHIEFDTREYAGKLRSTRIDIRHDIVKMNDSVNVALCSDPLYGKLCSYVFSNPTEDDGTAVVKKRDVKLLYELLLQAKEGDPICLTSAIELLKRMR